MYIWPIKLSNFDYISRVEKYSNHRDIFKFLSKSFINLFELFWKNNSIRVLCLKLSKELLFRLIICLWIIFKYLLILWKCSINNHLQHIIFKLQPSGCPHCNTPCHQKPCFDFTCIVSAETLSDISWGSYCTRYPFSCVPLSLPLWYKTCTWPWPPFLNYIKISTKSQVWDKRINRLTHWHYHRHHSDDYNEGQQ